MTPEQLISQYPRLYHMAELGSWPLIQRHGLLSTSALLDLFEIAGDERVAIESRHRPECIPIRHDLHGVAVVRDQKPMDDSGLLRSLGDGITPREWYELLNRRVFFWLDTDRLDRLLKAKAYRERRQTVLTIDTAQLLQRHSDRVRLSPINSGATKPMPAPRGRNTFLPVADYPYDSWRKKRGARGAVVELTVEYAVPDIVECVQTVVLVGGGEPEVALWSRP